MNGPSGDLAGPASDRRVEWVGPASDRRAAWGWILVLVVGLTLFEAVRRALIATGNPNLAPTLLLVGALVVPATFVTFVDGRRLRHQVPAAVLALVAVGGGVVGVVIAGILEYDTLRRLGFAALLGVAVIEEAAKLVVPALVLMCGPWRRTGAGLVVGVASGAGFAVLETMGYAFTTLINSHGDISTVDGVLMIRGVLSPAAHMAWTGLTAAGLWWAAQQHFSRRACVRLAGVFALAVGLHTAWDGIGTPVGYAIVAAAGLGSLAVVVHRLAAGSAGPDLSVSKQADAAPAVPAVRV